jgi:hypothetical protein
MAYDIRLPNITATTERGQLEQIRSYLYQFAEQLKYAVNVIELNTSNAVAQAQTASTSVADPTPEQRLKQFNNLKNLIISSADIVNAYSEEIRRSLEGEYVAQSEFGIYKEETTMQVVENSKNLTEYYEKLETIDEWTQKTSAYIRTGELEVINGEKIYGVEVGVMTEDETGDTDNKGVARFTPTKTVFYDGQKNEMAVLSNRELIIDGIVCGGNFYLGRTGGFVMLTSSETGLSIKPTGRVI